MENKQLLKRFLREKPFLVGCMENQTSSAFLGPPSSIFPTPVLLTNAVSGWGHVEARLAAQDTAIGTRAVLTPPGSTHRVFLVFTLINICPQSHEKGQLCG